MKCKDCKWWQEIADAELGPGGGYCRRYPPKVGENDDHLSPWVKKDEWCGEFEASQVKPSEAGRNGGKHGYFKVIK